MRLRNLVMGGIALSIALLPQMALADEKPADAKAEKKEVSKESPAPINELDQNRRGRGFNFAPIVPTHAVAAPVTAPVVNTRSVTVKAPVVKAASTTKPVTHVATAKHQIIKAVPKQAKHEETLTAKHTPAPSIVEPKHSQTSVLVNYKQEDGPVISAKLDKEGTLPKYKVGDKMVVNVRANQDCNVVVFNYDSSGTLTQIFPNDYQQNGFVKAGDAIEIGGSDSPFDYQISGKGGPEKVFVYAYPTSDKQAPITQLTAMAPISGTPFRGTEMTIDKYRDMVNNSRVFFARSVQVMPKKGAQLVSQAQPASSPNKVELTFSVDAK